jgi:glutathione peroxidase
MVQLHRELRDRGFNILAFPCNQFMSQEPGTEAEIKVFAQSKGVEFPMFSKINVNGKETHNLYRFLRKNSSLKCGTIGWNFGKFLVARDGSIFGYYGPRTDPNSIRPDIDRLM